MNYLDLIGEVVALHNIARNVEQQLGTCELTHDIRKCADRLSEVASNLKEKTK